jgi:hypothetical protein
MGLILRGTVTAIIVAALGWFASMLMAMIADPIPPPSLQLVLVSAAISISLFSLFALWYRTKADKIYGRPWNLRTPDDMSEPSVIEKYKNVLLPKIKPKSLIRPGNMHGLREGSKITPSLEQTCAKP